MTKKPVIILGAGGHAKVLKETLSLLGIEILGFTAPNKDTNFYGLTYLGSDSIIKEYSPKDILLVNGVGSTHDVSLRKELFCKFKKIGYNFTTVVHPYTFISKNAVIKEGVQIMAGAVIQSCCSINENSVINTNVSVDHDTIIGRHVHLAPGVTISGNVNVGEQSHIGTGASVIQGVDIGGNNLVGAGSTVVMDTLPNQKVIGVPAKEI